MEAKFEVRHILPKGAQVVIGKASFTLRTPAEILGLMPPEIEIAGLGKCRSGVPTLYSLMMDDRLILTTKSFSLSEADGETYCAQFPLEDCSYLSNSIRDA